MRIPGNETADKETKTKKKIYYQRRDKNEEYERPDQNN
jgi:hypothetical protein